MNNLLRPLVAIGVLASLAVAANATITFSNITAADDSGANSAVGYVDPSFSNVVHFKFDDASVIGGDVITGTFGYTVHSTLGLTLAQIDANGYAKGQGGTSSSVEYDVTHVGYSFSQETITAANGELKNLQGVDQTLSDFSYDVTGTFRIAAGTVRGSAALGKIDVTYSEAVPEPASFAALAIGGLGLLARRRKGVN